MTAIFEMNEIGRRPRGKGAAALSAGVAILALTFAIPAHAQGSGPADGDEQAGEAQRAIVVTGTRITSTGFSAPTPTQVLDLSAIAQNAQPNIFTTIAQLPSLQGSTGVTSGTNSTSSGTQGLSSFSLHGVGAIRTLTLLDGQRVVGANVTGVPDISLFPQILVKRVDVVTGGASASYGSDAVGGVVNFITDTRFEGFRANLQGGISTYGDNAQGTVQAAYGAALLDNRLHIVVSGEYSHEDGVGPGGFGEEGPGGRDWYRTSTLVNTGVRTAGGGPQYRYFDHVQAYQYTKYGLITSGPLQGTAFDAAGQPFTFNYGGNGLGQSGVPLKDAAGGVANCYIGFCVGGDLSGNVGIGTTMMSSVERWNGYGRVGFDIAPGHEIYGTVNVARVDTTTQPNPGASRNGLTIQCNNPFVPGLVQDACADNGITSFKYGVSNAILPNIFVKPSREQYRFVGGAKGEFELGGSPWSYDAYYEHGISTTHIEVDNMLLIPRFNQAIQATVIDGQVVCANATARANGCLPLNIFGGARPSDAVLSYLQPAIGPFQHTRQTQDVASLSFSGEAADLWAGPLSVAFGGEYRHEYYATTGDPYGAGITAQSPTTQDYPVDPLLAADGGNWYAGNYYNGTGAYHVYEGFLELNLPIFDSASVGKANLNGGVRVTNYSTSGTVWAWKAGGTWETPIDGLRIRAVTSRDIRAPNLSELFAAPRSINLPNFVDPFTNTSKSVLINLVGNPNLKPEIGRNTTVGVVFARPQWAPGLSLSVDYFAIKIKDVISSLGSSQVVEYCKDGIMDTCNAFDLNREPEGRNYINSQPFNFASIFINGLDIEASYQTASPFGLPGRIMVRGLATHVMHNRSDPGLPGTVASDSAGVNLGSTPDWTVLASQSWSTDKIRLTVQERWFSNGVYGNNYVVCQSSCPESTTNNPTIDRNRMRGAFYVDLSGSYNMTDKLQAYFKIDNLFNRDPEPAPRTDTGIDVNPALYDVVGRMYRVGVRYNF